MRTIEQKRESAQLAINVAMKRVQDAIDQNLAGYIVRSRQNALFVAHSDAAMLEAHIKLELA